MAAFSIPDLSNAITGYPALSVDLKIVDLNVVSPGTTGAVNINEIWGFKVQITNNGDLNMSDVGVHIVAKGKTNNMAQVSLTTSGPWADDTHVNNLAVNAGASVKTPEVYFKAPPNDTSGAIDLVQVHIANWNADLTYILTGKAGHSDPPNDTYKAQVYP